MNSELGTKNFLLINKPKGWTSFDVIAYARRRIGNHPERLRLAAEESKDPLTRESQQSSDSSTPRPERVGRNDRPNDKPKRLRVGHAGTLDPFATGLLIVGVGREATKRLDEFKKLPKTYVATLHLGAVSDTFDSTGKIQNTWKKIHDTNNLYIDPCILNRDEVPTEQQILKILQNFVGKQTQIPPMFSAKKVNGQRLYKLARQGKTVERAPCEIEIYDIRIKGYDYPLLKIEVTCSAGTYIRSLAHDIGQKLGTGAYCAELERTRIGDFDVRDAHNIDDKGWLLDEVRFSE